MIIANDKKQVEPRRGGMIIANDKKQVEPRRGEIIFLKNSFLFFTASTYLESL